MTAPIMPVTMRQRLTQARVVASAVAGSSTGGAAPVIVPAGVQAGDLLLFLSYISGASVNIPEPTDFTLITNAPSSGWNGGIVTSGRIADGSEIGASVQGVNGTTATGNLLLVIRGDAPISNFARNGAAYNQSNNNPSSATASATNAVGPCIAIGVVGARGASPYSPPPFETTTPAFTQQYAGSHCIRAGLTFYNEGQTPVDQVVDLADNGSGNLITTYFLNLTGA